MLLSQVARELLCGSAPVATSVALCISLGGKTCEGTGSSAMLWEREEKGLAMQSI